MSFILLLFLRHMNDNKTYVDDVCSWLWWMSIENNVIALYWVK